MLQARSPISLRRSSGNALRTLRCCREGRHCNLFVRDNNTLRANLWGALPAARVSLRQVVSLTSTSTAMFRIFHLPTCQIVFLVETHVSLSLITPSSWTTFSRTSGTLPQFVPTQLGKRSSCIRPPFAPHVAPNRKNHRFISICAILRPLDDPQRPVQRGRGRR